MPNRTLSQLIALGNYNPSSLMGEKQPDILLCKLGKEEREVAVL